MLSNKLPNIIRKLMDNMKLLLICILRVLLSHSFVFFRFYFFINIYMVLFLFGNVIYVFLLYDYILTVFMYDYTDWFFRAFSSVVRQMPG